MRAFVLLAIAAAAVAATPFAMAQETKDDASEPEDGGQAWVDDCPPDMMCAMGGGESAEEPTYSGDCGAEMCAYQEPDEPTYSGDCGGEVCAYDNPDEPVSSDDPAKGDGSTCMDGAEEGEDCRDDVQYMAPPGDGSDPASGGPATGEPAEADPISAPAEGAEGDGGITSVDESGEDAKSVPVIGVAGALAALAGAVALVGARRR